jgi:hypothetical protein
MVFDDESFVAHAAKYTKEQALELFNGDEKPYLYRKWLELNLCREVTISDVIESTCKYVAKAPFGSDYEGGCYLLNTGGRGSFNVWVIDTNTLKIDYGSTVY